MTGAVSPIGLTWYPWASDNAEHERNILLARGIIDNGMPTSAGTTSLFWCGVTIGGELRSGFPVHVAASRAVPGTRLIRLERFGGRAVLALGSECVGVLSALARRDPRALRVNISVYEAGEEQRHAIHEALSATGFRRIPPRMYEETLLVPLIGDEAMQLARLSGSTRRNLREATRGGIVVRPVVSPGDAVSLERLAAEAFRRHGAEPLPIDGAALLSGQGEHQIVLGAYLQNANGERLVGFALFRRFGEVAVYDVAGSSRSPELGRLPVAYPLLWEGLLWARNAGCHTMDLGGVPAADAVGDPRAGIAAFKAGFGGMRVTIGGEWICYPTPGFRILERLAKRLFRRRAFGE